jgi:predicted aspartyl protease
VLDLHEAKQGQRAADAVRRVEVKDALVDTGASALCVPCRLVTQLGLEPSPVRVTFESG